MMEMYRSLGNFLDNYGSPFFVGSLIEKKVLFVNKAAKTMFDCTEETCDFEKIFERTEERLESLIEKGLNSGKNSIFYNFLVNTGKKEQIVVDFQFGFFNDEKTSMFLEIIPQQDTRLQMALNQIRHSPRAEAILNLDENLSIVDCSAAFYKVFEANEELRHSHYKNDLVNGFLPEIRESLIANIHETFKTSDIFSTEIKVFTALSEEKWYRLDLQKRELDNSCTKLMCHMVNIEKEVKRKEENDLLNQYLTIMQESSPDILYRVDISENTLYHYSDMIPVGGKGKPIVDYVSVFISGEIMHPDDKEAYLQCFKSFFNEDVTLDVPIRFSFDGGDYRWYRIVGKKIYDSHGELVEVFGALLNVNSEVHLQEEVSTLNKYFDILNDITDESLYFYDLKTEQLRLGGLTEKEIGLPKVLENYEESLRGYVHPDDWESFQQFDNRALDSGNNRLELRFKNVDGTYQWYELLSNIIFDDDGRIVEIFGRIKNIQSKYELKTEIEEANNYLLVMQELSDDILYRIDVDAKTLVYTTKSASGEIITNTFENYPHSVLNRNLIHPDDKKIILEQAAEWISGTMHQYKIRMKLITKDFQWYQDSAINIRDKEGKVTEIYGRLQNIHAEETMVAEVSTLNQYVEAVQSLSGESLFYVDMKTLILRQKGDVAVELGMPEEVPNYPEGAYSLIHPEDLENYKIYARDTLNAKDSLVQCKVRTGTGEYQWYEIISKPIYNNKGDFVEIFGRMTNINQEMTMKADFSALNKQFSALQEVSDDFLFRIDILENTFYQSNELALSIGIMLKTENYVETFIANGNIHPDDVEHYRICNEKLKTGKLSQYEMRAEIAKGVYHAVDVKCTLISSNTGEPIEIFGRMKDIQGQKDLEARANQDLMTQVLNKVSFEESAATVLGNNHDGFSHAIIFIDLDDFKGVNDTLGHSFGDALLTTVGKRLKRVVRESDLIGRLGGDEFAVMLKSIGTPEAATLRVQLLLDTLQRPFSFHGKTVRINASIGFAIAPQHGDDYMKLIKKADIALYSSKRKGKNVATLYSEELEEY